MQRHELPSPEAILEELADKTAAQIDRLAPVAFEAALKEMQRYHRFLLSLNATRDTEGKVSNYASIQTDLWRAPHQEWIAQYRRLFERAANRIGEDSSFISKLAYVPLGLLPGKNDVEFPEDVIRSILDLGPILIHRLEAWVTKRSVLETPPGEAATPRVALAGSDAKAYANVLPEILGAWEALLTVVPSLYQWSDEQKENDAVRWDALRASWPFLSQHLRHTANMFATAVWNEDDVGSRFFRDALVLWPERLRHEIGDYDYFPQRRRLFPDLFSQSWVDATASIKPLLPQYMDSLGADELFSATLLGAYDDVLLLTSTLLLSWSMDQKQASDIASRRAAELVRHEVTERDGSSGGPATWSFRSLIMQLLRLETAGERFQKSTYGSSLDHFVETLDNMTERRVVPGRIFTPSTSHGRDDLNTSLLAMVVCAAPADGDDSVVQRIKELAEDAATLPEGDGTLRDILHRLSWFRTSLETPPPVLERGVKLVKPDKDFESARRAVLAIIASSIGVIEHVRKERLRQLPVDDTKLEALRDAVQSKLQVVPGGVPIFRGFEIEKTTKLSGIESEALRTGNLSKAQFVEPPMEPPSLNFTEVYVDVVKGYVGHRIWKLFADRSKIAVSVASRINEPAYWQEVAKLASDVGAEPVLVVSRAAEGRALRQFVHRPAAVKSPLKVERKNREDTDLNTYIATVDGIEVHGTNLPPGSAWLFSTHLLKSVRYLDDGNGNFVRLEFVLEEGFNGALIAEFKQEVVWESWVVYEINYEDPAEPPF